MTTDPLATLEDAIRTYIATHPEGENGVVTDWIILASTWEPEHDGEGHGYWKIIPDRQAIHSTLGLLEQVRHTLLANATASTLEGDE